MSRAGGDPTPRSSGPDPDPTLVGDPPARPDFATDETLAGDLSPGARASSSPATPPPDLDRSTLSQRERALQLTRYVLVRRLGAGGMGVVYLAYDPSLDRKVAIKLLRVAPGDGPAQAAHARLLREAQALARLSHGNVVAVHDVGSYDAEALTTLRMGPNRTEPVPKDRLPQAAGVFLVMEYVPGITLAQWLDARVRGLREVLDVFLAAGRGLVAAHAVGIIHRDFKPGNVLVGETGRICVFDFGLARSAGEAEPTAGGAPDAGPLIDPLSSSLVSGPLTRVGTLVGTPAYMAPEQRGGAAIDERADQFSFCVALYEGLYGNRPFSGDNLFALEAAKARGRIDPPRRAIKVPPAIHRAILRGLSPEPGDRWPSMQALLDALERPLRRDRRRWALAGGGVALVAGAIAFALAGDAPALCTGAPEALAPTWNPERRAALADAFAATGLPYAPDAAARAGARIDVWAESWIAGHTDACAAANIRGEQSQELLDRRMHCLEDRRHELDALLGVLAGADADAVEHARDAVEALPPPARCADLDALRAEVDSPPPALVDAVQALRDQLSVAHAEATAGHPGAGLTLIEAAEQRSRDLGYRPLRAQVLAELADQLFDASRYDEGARVFGEAYWEALAAGDDRLAFKTASAFAGRLAQVLSHPDDAQPWLRHAEALYERLDRPPHLGGDLELRRGQIAEARREYVTAIDHYRRSLADIPDRSREAVSTRQNLANVHLSLGQLDLAQAIFEELLALRRDIYGEGHPNNAFSLADLGNVATLRGDFDTAEKHHRAALAILRAALPPRHERLAFPLSALADIAAQRGDFGAALDAFDEARSIWEHHFGPQSTRVAAMLERLASVQLVRGELGLAEQHASRALAIWSSAQSPDPQGTVLAHLALAQIELARDNYTAARDHTDLALPIATSVLGEDNLYTAVSRAMRAVALVGLGDLSAAEREADAAVTSIERNYGADSLWMSEVLTPRARVRHAQGRHDEARRDLDRSLALLDPQSAPIQRAHAEFQLAQVLWDSRADRAQARSLATSAQTRFERAGAKHYRAEVETWLERHPA
ncbi:tetratricopeptide repeat protein [Nannocystis punicea]|uniref:Tetratricopeptide repeat protein n=1 Tax=Nannocystis punicea TaxID=2995304 RepID=A0ABY7HG33_9BACT|nr:tetratricopeptide repeat protein [Nannocystis poenicansa]WAS98261.1 tetratricopeptide repeat protein [Nannocystis poenicansa]